MRPGAEQQRAPRRRTGIPRYQRRPADPNPPSGDPATCQVVQAPSGTGQRLVPDLLDLAGRAPGSANEEAEIRLTYRELSALIEEAIRSLGTAKET